MSIPIEMPTALTTAEVMRTLKVKDADTVHSLRRRKKIRGVKLGRGWRYDADSVIAFLKGDPPEKAKEKKQKTPEPDWMKDVEKLI